MILPSGWIFIPRIKDRITIEVERKDLVMCKNCIWYNTDDCKWRRDELPKYDDFCSAGESE